MTDIKSLPDRELLELAAKYCGKPIVCYESRRNCMRIGTRYKYSLWNPLRKHGDLARMLSELRMGIF